MNEFLVWALLLACALALLLFLIKLYCDHLATARGVAGALTAPRRSRWLALVGFFAALVAFPITAALSLRLSPLDLYVFWQPELLSAEEARGFATGLGAAAFGTIGLFFLLHLLFGHMKHLPWFDRRTP